MIANVWAQKRHMEKKETFIAAKYVHIKSFSNNWFRLNLLVSVCTWPFSKRKLSLSFEPSFLPSFWRLLRYFVLGTKFITVSACCTGIPQLGDFWWHYWKIDVQTRDLQIDGQTRGLQIDVQTWGLRTGVQAWGPRADRRSHKRPQDRCSGLKPSGWCLDRWYF